MNKFKLRLNKIYNYIFKEKFYKKINIDWSNFPNRSDIIQSVIDHKNFKSYLEIGCDLNQVFASVYQKLDKQGVLVFTVEQGFEADYFLQKTGRYAHHKNYIHRLIAMHSFERLDEQCISLRKQQGKEVMGYLFVLKKVSSSE